MLWSPATYHPTGLQDSQNKSREKCVRTPSSLQPYYSAIRTRSESTACGRFLPLLCGAVVARYPYLLTKDGVHCYHRWKKCIKYKNKMIILYMRIFSIFLFSTLNYMLPLMTYKCPWPWSVQMASTLFRICECYWKFLPTDTSFIRIFLLKPFFLH